MTAVVFYFQVHQPYRLNPAWKTGEYFDDGLNEFIVQRVAEKCYLPMNAVLRDAIDRTGGEFSCSFSLSGTALQQIEDWAPEALDSFQELAATGSVEFLCETSHHSLSFLRNEHEFEHQIENQRHRIQELFGARPVTFRNTELVFDNDVARRVEALGFDALLGEGADRLLRGRSPNVAYRCAGTRRLKLLLRSYVYSDDIAFRFSNETWEAFPLMADTFAGWLDRVPEDAPFIGLFMDYETFGEHQGEGTGILEFMEHLPGYVLENPRFRFETPARVAGALEPAEVLDVPDPVSWADAERDLTAWLGNPMQRDAHAALYDLCPLVRAAADRGDREILHAWRKLTTSDHVYYMSTKWHSDGDVHEYFSPYDTPHDAFHLFMSVLEDMRRRAEHGPRSRPRRQPRSPHRKKKLG